MTRSRWFLGAAFLGLSVFATIGLTDVPESAFERDPYPKEEGPLQVFILAGQSNMQGQGSLRNLEYLIYNQETSEQYEHLKDNKGDWVPRNDVWVWTTDGQRSGSLKPGFGSGPWKFGPELGYGWTIGKQLSQQVLLIKTCWGGKSVRRDFLSPRSDPPALEQLQQELERAQKSKADTTIDDVQARYGEYYRRMIEHVRDVLDHLKQHFPDYDESRGYELAGFVWFQGWNDMVDGQQRAENYAGYTMRLAQMLRDVRQELKAPELPVIIGELGVGGEEGGNPQFRAAQKAVAELPEFHGTIKVVVTHPYWEPDVEEMVKTNIWRGPEWPKFYNVGSDRGYHYLGSGKMMYQMGTAFAHGMVELLEGTEP